MSNTTLNEQKLVHFHRVAANANSLLDDADLIAALQWCQNGREAILAGDQEALELATFNLAMLPILTSATKAAEGHCDGLFLLIDALHVHVKNVPLVAGEAA